MIPPGVPGGGLAYVSTAEPGCDRRKDPGVKTSMALQGCVSQPNLTAHPPYETLGKGDYDVLPSAPNGQRKQTIREQAIERKITRPNNTRNSCF